MKKHIPTYVVTGFLSTGKTSYINSLLKNSSQKTLAIQFEQGVQSIAANTPNVQTVSFDIHNPKDFTAITQKIQTLIANNSFEKIFIEFNGMSDFKNLESIIFDSKLSNFLTIKEVVYISTTDFVLNMLKHIGPSQFSQIYNADKAKIWQNEANKTLIPAAKKSLRLINPKIKFSNGFYFKLLSLLNFSSLSLFLIIFTLLVWAKIIPATAHVIKILSIIAGVCLEAFPFLLLGAFFSAILQKYISIQQIENLLKSNPIKASLIAILQGIIVPICDCGIINVFRALIIRKVPLPIAILYLLATPFMNPFVMLSTYYAFSGNIAIVATRIGLALLCAGIVSLTFINYSDNPLLKNSSFTLELENNTLYSRNIDSNSRYYNVINYTQNEFLNMSKYVIIGATISALFQVYLWPILVNYSFVQIPIFAITTGFVFAFILSLCATADAMIASSLINQLSFKGVFSFMLLGPVFDLKNFLLLRKVCTYEFIIRLALTIIITITAVIYLTSLAANFVGVTL